MENSTRTCELCGSHEYKVICTRDRRGKPWNTAACTTCGLVGHENLPSEAELASYYANHYRQDYHGETSPSSRRVSRAWLKGQRLLHTLKSLLPAGESVFEIGAGLGCTVKVFELAGYRASGLEPGTAFREFSAHRLHANVSHGSVFDFQPGQTFDNALLIHVIEHFRSPRLALQKIHQLLRPGGRLYLECPSLGTVHTELAELFHFAHIHTFTPSTLLQLLRETGFTVEHCFSNGVGCNHKMLLRRVEPTAPAIDPAGFQQTCDFLARYRQPWRRWSPSYLNRRMRRFKIYAREWIWGNSEVRHILRQCEQAAAA